MMYGLKTRDGTFVTLQSVDVKAVVYDNSAEVTLQQTYHNHSESNLECVYEFPLDENAAVVEFKAHINAKVLVGVIREREEARREYEKAKLEQKTTVLLEQQQANIFTMNVGCIKGMTITANTPMP